MNEELTYTQQCIKDWTPLIDEIKAALPKYTVQYGHGKTRVDNQAFVNNELNLASKLGFSTELSPQEKLERFKALSYFMSYYVGGKREKDRLRAQAWREQRRSSSLSRPNDGAAKAKRPPRQPVVITPQSPASERVLVFCSCCGAEQILRRNELRTVNVTVSLTTPTP